jgi:hypothetical protein
LYPLLRAVKTDCLKLTRIDAGTAMDAPIGQAGDFVGHNNSGIGAGRNA